MELHMYILLIYGTFDVVASYVCQHPGLVTSKEENITLYLDQYIKRTISCNIINGTDQITGTISSENNTIKCLWKDKQSCSKAIPLKTYKKRCGKHKIDVEFVVGPLAITNNYNGMNSSCRQKSCLVITHEKLKISTSASIYHVHGLSFAFFSTNADKGVLLKMLKRVVSENNSDLWETDMENVTVSFKTVEINENNHNDLHLLDNFSISYNLAFHQMWLECKLHSWVQNSYKSNDMSYYEYILWLFIIGFLICYLFGVIINYLTMRKLKHVKKKNKKRFWSCFNHALSMSVVSDYFKANNEIIEDQLYMIVKALHSITGPKGVRNHNTDYKYDYARISGYLELRRGGEYMTIKRNTVTNNEYFCTSDMH